MRIISGKYKGHSLASFDASHIRPTTDRVKESLFNILMQQVPDARVLDLFCGTGSLGLEALSRGANSVVFVDQNVKSLAILKKNIALLKITEPYSVVQKDVFSYLGQAGAAKFDLIFADPPFTEKIAHDVMLKAAKSSIFLPHTVMAIESERRERIEDDYDSLVRFDHREFGDKVLSFFKAKGDIA